MTDRERIAELRQAYERLAQEGGQSPIAWLGEALDGWELALDNTDWVEIVLKTEKERDGARELVKRLHALIRQIPRSLALEYDDSFIDAEAKLGEWGMG